MKHMYLIIRAMNEQTKKKRKLDYTHLIKNDTHE